MSKDLNGSKSLIMPGMIDPLMNGVTQMRLSVQQGSLVLQFEKDIGWLSLNKTQAIEFVQALAAHINTMAG